MSLLAQRFSFRLCAVLWRKQDFSEELADTIPATVGKISKAAQMSTTTLLEEIARALIRQEGDRNLARERLQALRKLLRDAEIFLEGS
jgi:hypothetical protein